MTLALATITFDCHEPLAVAAFWSAALDRPVADDSSEYFAQLTPAAGAPGWFFIKVPEGTLPQVRSQAWQVQAPL